MPNRKIDSLNQHLDFDAINALLDRTLVITDIEPMEKHISSCDRCRTEYKEIKSLIDSLETVTDISIEHSLVPQIISRIKENDQLLARMKFGALVQLSLGTLLLVIVSPFLQIDEYFLMWTENISNMISFVWTGTIEAVLSVMALFQVVLSWFRLFEYPGNSFDISEINIWILLVSALLLFALGNGIFLSRMKNIDLSK